MGDKVLCVSTAQNKVLLGRTRLVQEPTEKKPELKKSMSLRVRTTEDDHMPPAEALQKLKAGNDRYIAGEVEAKTVCQNTRGALKHQGQRPMATILGCADSRVALISSSTLTQAISSSSGMRVTCAATNLVASLGAWSIPLATLGLSCCSFWVTLIVALLQLQRLCK